MDSGGWGLALSGGGFRATLFHLGVVRLLHDTGTLTRVSRISAVSGGSALAAHLALHWREYTGTAQQFHDTAREVIAFTQRDVRGRVVRRWLCGWLLVAPRLLGGSRWSLLGRLQHEYDRLYRGRRLGHLAGAGRPHVHLCCASMTTGALACFDGAGFEWHDPRGGGEREPARVPATEPAIALAVAASSAFPPLFPPLRVDAGVLGCRAAEFPEAQYLTDGGVYDNLGIERLSLGDPGAPGFARVLVSDAGARMDWRPGEGFRWPVSRNVRTAEMLMERVGVLSARLPDPGGAPVTRIEIGTPAGGPPELCRRLAAVRTDLDDFSSDEADALIRHGYEAARQVLVSSGAISAPGPDYSWRPMGREWTAPSSRAFDRSGARKSGLWSARDRLGAAVLWLLLGVWTAAAGLAVGWAAWRGMMLVGD